ncbi:MAG: hypothetical protein FJ135_09500 [Deltaproteobacteria bacterium]|nr:hypothetical protein [Deltaproteobacteria bacterium]
MAIRLGACPGEPACGPPAAPPRADRRRSPQDRRVEVKHPASRRPLGRRRQVPALRPVDPQLRQVKMNMGTRTACS